MEEMSQEELDSLLAEPERKTRKTKAKNPTRTHRVWHYELEHTFGENCANPQCTDPRNKPRIMTAVVAGERMCRFCFLGGWLEIEE